MPTSDEISAAVYIGAYTNQLILGRYFPEKDYLDVRNEYTSFTKAVNSRSITSGALERVFDALREMHDIARGEGVSEFRIAAASSIRQVENRSTLLLGCQKEFGVYPQILGGRDEARLNYIGAVSDVLSHLPVAMVFIGYQRILLAYGFGREIEGIRELEFGVGSINAKFGLDRHELGFFQSGSLRRFLRENLNDVIDPLREWCSGLKLTPQFLGVGPLAQSMYTLLERAHTYSRTMVASPLQTVDLEHLANSIRFMERDRLAKLPGLEPSAHESIIGGAEILRTILRECGIEDFRVSSYGLCAGLLKTPAGLLTTVKNAPGCSSSGTFLQQKI